MSQVRNTVVGHATFADEQGEVRVEIVRVEEPHVPTIHDSGPGHSTTREILVIGSREVMLEPDGTIHHEGRTLRPKKRD